MDECIFCKIIKGEVPASVVYEDDLTLAFMDLGHVNPGRTKVCSSMRFSFSSQIVWKRRSIAGLDHAEEGEKQPVDCIDQQRGTRE
jgi:hypothetical protein